MLETIMKSGIPHGELQKRINEEPILWIRFFSFTLSGICMGWSVRDAIHFVKNGWITIAIMVAIPIAICIQFSVFIYLLRHPVCVD